MSPFHNTDGKRALGINQAEYSTNTYFNCIYEDIANEVTDAKDSTEMESNLVNTINTMNPIGINEAECSFTTTLKYASECKANEVTDAEDGTEMESNLVNTINEYKANEITDTEYSTEMESNLVNKINHSTATGIKYADNSSAKYFKYTNGNAANKVTDAKDSKVQKSNSVLTPTNIDRTEDNKVTVIHTSDRQLSQGPIDVTTTKPYFPTQTLVSHYW